MEPYERLDAWRLCHDLGLAVYRLTDSLPAAERYGLTAQARRAAFSASANIVEGSIKKGRREFRRYLDIARGSLAETAYTLRFARDLGLIDQHQWVRFDADYRRAAIVLWKLYVAMK